MGKVFSKKRLKIGIPILIVLTIAAAILIFFKNMSGPAQGDVAQVPPTTPLVSSAYSTPGKFSDQYVSFTYPAHYQVVQSQKSGNYLDVISLHATDHSNKYISIGILREDLANDSGYNHRITYPATYKQISKTANGAVFVGIDTNAEQTGFIAHRDLVISISITTIGPADLSSDYNTIANSLTWQ